MSTKINRRDFLKLASLLPLSTPWIGGSNPLFRTRRTGPDTPNVLLLVFDTLSALDVSLYGHARDTMPNLARFAERATVYHAHYSGGNFTPPGTASILTGTDPLTHRAYNQLGAMLDSFASRNLFSEFGQGDYTRIAFSHNLLANVLLFQLSDQLEEFHLPSEVTLVDYNFADDLFRSDYNIAAQGERRYLKKPGQTSNSLFLHPLLSSLKTLVNRTLMNRLKQSFPRGIPGYHDMLYPLEDTIDWIEEQMMRWPQPFLAYLHMMPPHDPYCPRQEFVDIFRDDWEPVSKPDHFFSNPLNQEDLLNLQRVYYNEYIAYVDAEFGRLHDYMEAHGFYENTIVVFTSDHGEMFERKIWQHNTPVLFQPLIRVPLLLSLPGQTTRKDVHATTSCVDVLPTLLHLTGRPIPKWCEGVILPPHAEGTLPADRSLFAVEAKSNAKTGPLRKATVAMIKGDFKLIHYRGYEGFDNVFELYNLREDPEELEDIYATRTEIASQLKQELLAKIEEKDMPFLNTEGG